MSNQARAERLLAKWVRLRLRREAVLERHFGSEVTLESKSEGHRVALQMLGLIDTFITDLEELVALTKQSCEGGRNLTKLNHTTAALKAFLESVPGIFKVEITPDIIHIHPSDPMTLPLCLRLDCKILEAHQETTNGETVTIIDDFQIVSAKLIPAEDTGEFSDKEDPCPT